MIGDPVEPLWHRYCRSSSASVGLVSDHFARSNFCVTDHVHSSMIHGPKREWYFALSNLSGFPTSPQTMPLQLEHSPAHEWIWFLTPVPESTACVTYHAGSSMVHGITIGVLLLLAWCGLHSKGKCRGVHPASAFQREVQRCSSSFCNYLVRTL